MIVFYAMGGGLGHLARTRRMLTALAPQTAHAAVITASPIADAIEFGAAVEVIVAPRHRSRFPVWLRETLRALAPETVAVDAFPLGIFGELANPSILPEARLLYVARLLRWDAYRHAFPDAFIKAPRRYDTSHVLETLTPAHAQFVTTHSRHVSTMTLDAPAAFELKAGAPWLISHTGPQEEIDALHHFARRQAACRGESPTFALRAPHLPQAHDPALEPISALVTACGFNSMREGEAAGARHFFLPMARRFDHQTLRAVRRWRSLRNSGDVNV